jgi:hypothetical protein
LPEFKAVELLEEKLRLSLSQEGMEALAKRLEETYGYPCSVTYGHDWVLAPRSNDIGRVYLSYYTKPLYNGLIR